MQVGRFRHLPVVGADGTVRGVVDIVSIASVSESAAAPRAAAVGGGSGAAAQVHQGGSGAAAGGSAGPGKRSAAAGSKTGAGGKPHPAGGGSGWGGFGKMVSALASALGDPGLDDSLESEEGSSSSSAYVDARVRLPGERPVGEIADPVDPAQVVKTLAEQQTTTTEKSDSARDSAAAAAASSSSTSASVVAAAAASTAGEAEPSSSSSSSDPQDAPVFFKFSHAETLYRVASRPSAGLSGLVAAVCRAAGLPAGTALALTYRDDEGDFVAAAGDEAVVDAVGLARTLGWPAVRLGVTVVAAAAAAESTAGTDGKEVESETTTATATDSTDAERLCTALERETDGNACMRESRFEAALVAYTAALDAAPASASRHAARIGIKSASVQSILGDHAAAVRTLQAVCDACPLEGEEAEVEGGGARYVTTWGTL
jgi:hypothetical protein